MIKIYWITGDVHYPLDWSKIRSWYKYNPHFQKGDTIIIAGDAGFLWDNSSQEKKDLKKIEFLPFQILFIDGNHENFDLLNKTSTVQMYGNEVGKISENIFHLRRGNIYTIDNRTVWVMGGAPSHDKAYRIEGKTWWPQEIPTYAELSRGFYNAAECKKVDIIITHDGPDSIVKMINPYYGNDTMTRYFEFIKNEIEYNKWYFGHYHIDNKFDSQHYCLYQKILPL